jgi:lipopolysaccharide export system protein LptC
MFSLALLTFYLERTVRDDAPTNGLRRHDPDYLVSNFTTTTYREGAAESILSAAKMIHYPDDDTTELTAPRVVQSKPKEPRITVSADRGLLSRSGEEVFLYDNVQLVREALEGAPEARMTTSFLHVVRDRSLARTDRDVLIVEDQRSLQGRGMDYNYDSGQLTLHANVRGQLGPQSGSGSGPAKTP